MAAFGSHSAASGIPCRSWMRLAGARQHSDSVLRNRSSAAHGVQCRDSDDTLLRDFQRAGCGGRCGTDLRWYALSAFDPAGEQVGKTRGGADAREVFQAVKEVN